MDGQDAQDNQDGTPVHKKLTPAMIRYGFADAQDFRTTNCQKKILCILFIHVDKN